MFNPKNFSTAKTPSMELNISTTIPNGWIVKRHRQFGNSIVFAKGKDIVGSASLRRISGGRWDVGIYGCESPASLAGKGGVGVDCIYHDLEETPDMMFKIIKLIEGD